MQRHFRFIDFSFKWCILFPYLTHTYQFYIHYVCVYVCKKKSCEFYFVLIMKLQITKKMCLHLQLQLTHWESSFSLCLSRVSPLFCHSLSFFFLVLIPKGSRGCEIFFPQISTQLINFNRLHSRQSVFSKVYKTNN